MKKQITSSGTLFHTLAAAIFVLAVPATAHASLAASNIGSGRLLPTVAALIGLAGVFTGRWAMIHSRRAENRKVRSGALLALVSGLISLAIGMLHAVNSAGGFGTGNGLAGAIVAMILGLTALVFGRLALARSKRISTDNSTKKPF
jgi:heme/copper-type cytochrome/quinol oxidase subunit 3